MTPRRSELLEESTGNSSVPDESIANSVALPGDSSHFDPMLSKVIQAWPALSEATRQSILAIVGSVDAAE